MESTTLTDRIEWAGAPQGMAIARRQEGQIIELTVKARQDLASLDQPVTIHWHLPIVDMVGLWHTALGRGRSLRYAWSTGIQSHATAQAPVMSLFGADGSNRITFACSEALRPVELEAGVIEETGMMRCEVRLVTPAASLAQGPVTIRLDLRPIGWEQALVDMGRWWASMPLHAPSTVPEMARQPMYSTWYSFHQKLTPEAVLRQCELSRELGCEAVIVDDGWQTDDSSRGYGSCGDWQSIPTKLGDLRDFTRRVHNLGMKALLWYALPWVGCDSRAWQRFQGKIIRHNAHAHAGVLDPRYPEVRQHLIQATLRAIRNWDFDGLKLDFVDQWHDADAPPANEAMDIASVHAAADRVLSDLMAQVRSIKPDVMIEFRQRYIGPLMRKYGNIFRAADCPADAVTNRLRTLDIRLLAGETATHADMLMWHPDEPAAAAARQLLNVLFSVPQISVMLDRIPAPHQRMLRFWLGFWNEHRDVLLDGRLTLPSPEALYPIVRSDIPGKRVIALYADMVARLGDAAPDELLIVNATAAYRVVVESPSDLGTYTCQIVDTEGNPTHTGPITLTAGIHQIPIPPSGLARLTR